jgi:hypothetical protein
VTRVTNWLDELAEFGWALVYAALPFSVLVTVLFATVSLLLGWPIWPALSTAVAAIYAWFLKRHAKN